MKSFLLGIGSVLKSLQALLVGFGAFGLFAIALLDAGMIPLPGGPDVVLMTLSHLNNAMTPVYVLAVTLGSTLGCLFPYYIGLKTGEAALRRFSPEKRARVTALIDQYDLWAMLVGAVLPPPFPFKIFLITAGVFRMKVWRFLIALLIGRSIRYSLEGWMAVTYGDQAMTVFKQHYPKIGLALAGLIVLIVIINTIRSRRNREMTDGDLSVAE
ncbi:MAG: YqaA family protein [Blastocatellales bacterium]